MKTTNEALAPQFPAPAQAEATQAYSGPDVILPEQHFASNGLEAVAGERALMLAVLEDGIRCYQEQLYSPRVRPRLLARQSERWIRSEDWSWPYSFNNICDALSIEPENLRRKLLQKSRTDAPARTRASTHRVYRLTPRAQPDRKR